MALLSKPKYNTIRELERKNSGLFRRALLMGGTGIILVILGFIPTFSVIGIALIIAAAGIFFYGMMWMVKLQREPTRPVYCPYCASKNDVFRSRTEFKCDICNRRIAISSTGEPIPIEPIEDDEE